MPAPNKANVRPAIVTESEFPAQIAACGIRLMASPKHRYQIIRTQRGRREHTHEYKSIYHHRVISHLLPGKTVDVQRVFSIQ
jgi:hypothetical protein